MLAKCILLILVSGVFGFSHKKIHVGGLFDELEVQRAFDLSVNVVNSDRHQLSSSKDLYVEARLAPVDTDTFYVSEKVCEILGSGVVTIFGPQNKVAAEHVESICDTMEMPLITAAWKSSQKRSHAINMYPHAETLSMVFYSLVNEMEWKIFAILYENTDSLIRTQVLLKWRNLRDRIIFVYHLGDGPNYRSVMADIKNAGIENIVIDCSFEILEEVLKQAQQVGILSDRNRVLVTSLDLQAIDLEPYQYSGVNFTGLRLIDPEDPIVNETLETYKTGWGLAKAEHLRVEPALMYDAVQLFARGFIQFEEAVKVDRRNQLYCNGTGWKDGFSLSNFIKTTEMRGLTGLIKFDTAGFRSDFQLDIIRLTPEKVKKIGIWNTTTGIVWATEVLAPKSDVELSLQNRTFIVLISLTDPYGMLKESASMMTGNDRYEGFAVDIIIELSKILGFNYTFEVQADNVYGSFNNKTGQWTGMLRKIIEGEADLAITDLTITSERERGVDFTMPFMNLGISILYRKPTKAPPSLFSFLSPMSSGVWLYLIGAYSFVSVLFFVIGRLCPAEWTNPYPCIENPEELENQFTLKNSLWFTIGSIMQQGSEIAPIGISTRMLAGSWWFFCLIMVSSYTANLAASLTFETAIPPFSTVEELAKKDNIKYGAKSGGSTFAFFKNYEHSTEKAHQTYRKMYEFMKANEKDVLPSDNKEGIDKVIAGNYAFLMESSSIEYIEQRNCDLKRIGGLLDAKGYGIAMRKRSPYRTALNTAVLKLQESGIITQLRKKWWNQKRGGGSCEEESSTNQAEELSLDNVGGVFFVLTVGVALSCVYTLTELLWEVGCTTLREGVSFKEELLAELKFIARFNGASKPVRRRKGSSNRSAEDSTRGCTPPYGFIPTVITTSANEEK